ncbi:site-2 protease family protein [Microbulbifer pacificus]|uniref:site-2 protease family protein n=1 Tax=Microbulbifer pacificus TaxID=407164 RepID=UPI000CF3A02F|nr:site-2 protease family protein [Microbulbifer pacificus]
MQSQCSAPPNFAQNSQAAPNLWPPLRTDLQFHRVREDALQESWLLYDPLRGQYLELGELELLTLQHWRLGSASAIASAITQQRGCTVEVRQIEGIFRFAVDNELLQTSSEKLAQKQASITPQQRRLTRLQQTIFIRRPLFTPDRSSRLLLPLARCTAQYWFYIVLMAAIGFSAISIGQHWPEFLAYFSASWNAAGAAIFFCCYLLLSLVHELGHASVARLYGVRANSIGAGLIALMPIMYSEITDAWRLPRKARLHISAAGVMFELILGVMAALIWCLVDDGPLRALMFYLFTASLITTLMINANPLMKFDGYYLLSDITREKNLQQSATTILRQWSWSLLLRDHPAPRTRRQQLLGLFGLTSLIYRLLVFAGISYAAYQLLFKAAGILLFVICISLLLIIPAMREIQALRSYLREQNMVKPGLPAGSPTKHTENENSDMDNVQPESAGTNTLQRFRPTALCAAALLLALLFTPLPWPMQIPASTYFSAQQKVMAPTGAVLKQMALKRGDKVNAGELIAELYNDDLVHRIQRTRAELALLNRRQNSDGFAESLDALDGVYLQDLLSKQQLLRRLETELKQLQVTAKVSGTVDWTMPGLHPGQYLDLNQPFISIAARGSLAGRAYGEARQVARLHLNADANMHGQFFVLGRWTPIAVRVQSIEKIASRTLQDPALTTDFGGPLQTQPDDRERTADALHVITFNFDPQQSALSAAQRTGYLVLYGEPVSLVQLLTRRIAGVFIRESGV